MVFTFTKRASSHQLPFCDGVNDEGEKENDDDVLVFVFEMVQVYAQMQWRLSVVLFNAHRI